MLSFQKKEEKGIKGPFFSPSCSMKKRAFFFFSLVCKAQEGLYLTPLCPTPDKYQQVLTAAVLFKGVLEEGSYKSKIYKEEYAMLFILCAAKLRILLAQPSPHRLQLFGLLLITYIKQFFLPFYQILWYFVQTLADALHTHLCA